MSFGQRITLFPLAEPGHAISPFCLRVAQECGGDLDRRFGPYESLDGCIVDVKQRLEFGPMAQDEFLIVLTETCHFPSHVLHLRVQLELHIPALKQRGLWIIVPDLDVDPGFQGSPEKLGKYIFDHGEHLPLWASNPPLTQHFLIVPSTTPERAFSILRRRMLNLHQLTCPDEASTSTRIRRPPSPR